MSYKVKELFYTLQGEGAHAGRAAVFVRLAGCNLWSGRDADRASAAASTGARCPLFCDTDFVGGKRMTAKEIAAAVSALSAGRSAIVVVTGGEPLLQFDDELNEALLHVTDQVCIETNGTQQLPALTGRRPWICCSPKLPPDRLRLQTCDEIKVVVPSHDPLLFSDFALRAGVRADRRYVQPEDGPQMGANTEAAIHFVRTNPTWRLSVQTHKMIGVP